MFDGSTWRARTPTDYLQNLAGLGVDQIDQMPKATESMDETYRFDRGVDRARLCLRSRMATCSSTSRATPSYGKLTNRTVDALQGEGGEAAAKKRSRRRFCTVESPPNRVNRHGTAPGARDARAGILSARP